MQTRFGNFDIRPKAGQTIIPRNYAEGPGFFSVNLRVGRSFSFGDLPGAAERRRVAKEQEEQQRQNRNNRGGADRSASRGGTTTTGGGAPRGGGGAPQVTSGLGGGMMISMGGPSGAEGKRYTMNFSLNFINLLNRTNYGNPVGQPPLGQLRRVALPGEQLRLRRRQRERRQPPRAGVRQLQLLRRAASPTRAGGRVV